MMYSTTNTYAMKRDIIGFSEKLSAGLYRPDCKFTADMLYGLLASGWLFRCGETACPEDWKPQVRA